MIKSADKGFVAVVWGRDDYIEEADKQLGDKDIYEEACNDPGLLISTVLRAIESIQKRGNHKTFNIIFYGERPQVGTCSRKCLSGCMMFHVDMLFQILFL